MWALHHRLCSDSTAPLGGRWHVCISRLVSGRARSRSQPTAGNCFWFGIAYVGGLPVGSTTAVGSTTSFQVPWRRLAGGLGSAILYVTPLGPEYSDAVEVVTSGSEAEQERHFGLSEDPEEAVGEVVKVPLRAALADSTSRRRPIDSRQAVVSNGILCHPFGGAAAAGGAAEPTAVTAVYSAKETRPTPWPSLRASLATAAPGWDQDLL